MVPYGERLPRGHLKEIIEGVTSKYGVGSSDACSVTIRKRGTRFDNVILHQIHGGHSSSMAKFKDKRIGLIIQRTCIMYHLTPSRYLQLRDALISGTQRERNVVDFKINLVLINQKMMKYC